MDNCTRYFDSIDMMIFFSDNKEILLYALDIAIVILLLNTLQQ